MSEAAETLFSMTYSGRDFQVKRGRKDGRERFYVYDSAGNNLGYSSGDILPGNVYQARFTGRTQKATHDPPGLMRAAIAEIVNHGVVTEWRSEYLSGLSDGGKKLYRRLSNDPRLSVKKNWPGLINLLREGRKYIVKKRNSS